MRTDKRGAILEDYPPQTEYGVLLGFNAYGNAVFSDEETVSLAILGDDGDLQVPPSTYWTTHDLPLERLGLSRLEYVRYLADEHGPWRALVDPIRTGLEPDVDPDSLTTDAAGDPDTVRSLVKSLADADEWDQRAEFAGELRLSIMDTPDAEPELVARLLPLLDDVNGERDPIGDDRTAGSSAVAPELERDFDRIATRRDVAFAIARVTRSRPGLARESLPSVVRLAGDAQYHEPETAYKRHLIHVLNLLTRADPEATASQVETLLAAPSASTRSRTVRALTQLEQEYPGGTDPLVADVAVRDRLDALAEDDDDAVSQAIADLSMVRELQG